MMIRLTEESKDIDVSELTGEALYYYLLAQESTTLD